MEDLIDKLEREQLELSFKISKLTNFLKSDKNKYIDKISIELMKTQLFFMNEYNDNLLLRIKHLRDLDE